MDQDRINFVCISNEYERGLKEFIQFAQRNANNSGHDGVKFRYPCINCLNRRTLYIKKNKGAPSM